jgi:hypothetical protein
MMTLNEIMEMDKNNTCAHEAGHVIVARHFKIAAEAVVWQAPYRDAFKDRLVLGRTFFYDDMTPFRKSCIGYAGIVAEGVLSGDIEEEWDLGDVMEYGEPSATDEEYINSHPQKWRAIKTTLNILKRRKEELISEKEKLAAMVSPLLPLTGE